MPKISIITICYNEPGLENTCHRILNQTFKDYEWIVIDGGSTKKEIVNTLAKYRAKMSYFVSEKDGGIYDAMNKGILRASGEWVIFMNAGDCFYMPDTLENMAHHLDYRKYDLVFGYILNVGENSSRLGMHRILQSDVNHEFWLWDCLPHQAEFIKRTLFNEFGLYRTDYQMISDIIKDMEFWRAGVRFRFIDIPVALFDNMGLSSNIHLYQLERNRLTREYFAKELNENRLCVQKKLFYMLMCIVPSKYFSRKYKFYEKLLSYIRNGGNLFLK